VARDASYWIEKLELAPHPEGGYYRETYRAPGRSPVPRSTGVVERSYSTAIFYLLPSDEVSALHRLQSDELFHFYDGSALTIHVLEAAGDYRRVDLGPEVENGQRLQATVVAGSWFGATVEQPRSYALVGCTVAPGFEFPDFELADRAELVRRFPDHRAVVERLTVPKRP